MGKRLLLLIPKDKVRRPAKGSQALAQAMEKFPPANNQIGQTLEAPGHRRGKKIRFFLGMHGMPRHPSLAVWSQCVSLENSESPGQTTMPSSPNDTPSHLSKREKMASVFPFAWTAGRKKQEGSTLTRGPMLCWVPP